jgi:hypothetical protein
MTEVSDTFAFVLGHGATADEILFHDDDDGPIPGLTEEEREAIAGIEPHLEASWIGVLTACREAFWREANGHAVEAATKTRKTQRAKMFEHEEVNVPLIAGAVTSGFALSHWGHDVYKLHVWVHVKTTFTKGAEEAVAGLQPHLWRNKHGSFIVSLEAPAAGQSFVQVGEQAAGVLWSMAKPVCERVLLEMD